MKTKKTPMRKCVGCTLSRPKRELVRIAAYEGRVFIDPTGKAKGRGVYLCPDKECMAKAAKRKAIGRSLETEVTKEQSDKLVLEFEEYAKKNP